VLLPSSLYAFFFLFLNLLVRPLRLGPLISSRDPFLEHVDHTHGILYSSEIGSSGLGPPGFHLTVPSTALVIAPDALFLGEIESLKHRSFPPSLRAPRSSRTFFRFLRRFSIPLLMLDILLRPQSPELTPIARCPLCISHNPYLLPIGGWN